MVKKVVKKKQSNATKNVQKNVKGEGKVINAKSSDEKNDDVEFNFNFRDLKKYKSLFFKLIPVFLILILMFYAAFIRMGAVDLNGLEDNVRSNVLGNVKLMIEQDVTIQYPNLNELYKQEEVNKRYAVVLETGVVTLQGQTMKIDDIVQDNFDQIKDKFQIDGQTYLTAIDPYTFYRYSSNMLESGHQGEVKEINSKTGLEQNKDVFRLAPNGKFIDNQPSMHTYVMYYLYKFNGLTVDSTTAEKFKAIFLIPVFLVMLTVIPAFLIMKKITNNSFAFMGSAILFSVGIYLSRTTAGFVDTDAYNVLFPLLLVMFLIFALMSKNVRLNAFYSFLAGLTFGLFLWAWGAGTFMFLFTIVALLGYIGFKALLILINEKKIKLDTSILITTSVYLISAVLFSFIISSKNIIKSTLGLVMNSSSGLGVASVSNIWPNVYSSVAELNAASLNTIINSLGGQLVFFMALMGIFYVVYDSAKEFKSKLRIANIVIYLFTFSWFFLVAFKNTFISYAVNSPLSYLVLVFIPIGIAFIANLWSKNVDDNIFIGILLSIWMAGTIYMSLDGVRFILLLATPAAIGFALGMYYMSKYSDEFLKNELHIKKNLYLGTVTFVIIFIFVFAPIFQTANAMSKQSTPNLTDGWYNSLIKIKEESPENAIISSWWDFGHEFAAIAERGVTFDGASQTTPQSHWIGKVLLENDEDMSMGILKMLVCSGNNAFEFVEEISNPEDRGTNIVETLLYSILPLDLTDEERFDIIKDYKYHEFSDDEANELIKLVNCEEPPEDYFITSEDMVGKAGVWGHWGSWSFTKKYVYDNYKTMSAEKMSVIMDRDVEEISKYKVELEAIDFKSDVENVKRENLINQWFADYPGYIPIQGKYLYNCFEDNNTISCETGFTIDMNNGEVSSPDPNMQVRRVIYPTENNEMAILEVNKDAVVDLTLIPSGEGKMKVLMSIYPLGNSLFTKLFYLNGHGVENFELFNSVQTVVGWKVSTWKVDWKERTKTVDEMFEIVDSGDDIEEVKDENANNETIEVETVVSNVSNETIVDLEVTNVSVE